MKKFILILAAVIILIIILILALRSCEPRIKPAEEGSEETTDETSIEESGDEDLDALYQSAFIKANTEFTCQILETPSLAEDEAQMKENLNTAYKKYGLPVDDDGIMIKILDKYENDEAVIAIIKENVRQCAPQE